MATKGDPVRTVAWERAWEESPQFRLAHRVLTFGSGVAFLADAVLRVVVVFRLPIDRAAWLSNLPHIAAGAILIVLWALFGRWAGGLVDVIQQRLALQSVSSYEGHGFEPCRTKPQPVRLLKLRKKEGLVKNTALGRTNRYEIEPALFDRCCSAYISDKVVARAQSPMFLVVRVYGLKNPRENWPNRRFLHYASFRSEAVTFLISLVVCGRKAPKSICQQTLPGSFDFAP